MVELGGSFRAAAITATERGARGDGWAVCVVCGCVWVCGVWCVDMWCVWICGCGCVLCVVCAVGGMGADTIGACRSSAMPCSGRQVSQSDSQAVSQAGRQASRQAVWPYGEVRAPGKAEREMMSAG